MALEIGKEAPAFELRATSGELVRLEDFRGSKNVLLVFYPGAFTRTCTSEFCTLSNTNTDIVEDDDVVVFGVSTDTVAALREWKSKEGFRNEFLSDFWPHGAVSRAYEVFHEGAGVAMRGTYLIDTEGILRWMENDGTWEARDQGTWRDALAAVKAHA